MGRIAALALAVGIGLGSGVAEAQRGTLPPLDVAEATADCVTRNMTGDLSRPAWVEDWPGRYRVVIPLRGRPDASREVQTPPPADDALAWLDLHRYDRPAQPPIRQQDAPVGIVVVHGGSASYMAEYGGYPYFGALSTGEYCLTGAWGML